MISNQQRPLWAEVKETWYSSMIESLEIAAPPIPCKSCQVYQSQLLLITL